MIPNYAIDFHDSHIAPFDLTGRRVLEVGCGYAQLMRLVLDYHGGIEELVGINYPDIPVPNPAPNAKVLVMDATAMDFDNDSFDFVYSLATFEHIHDFAGVLSEIHRVLKPGGTMVAKWSPIWNGFDGHHYGPTLSDPTHRAIELPWAHLIFDQDSLPGYLEHGEGFSSAQAKSASEAIYHAEWLSRLTVHEYEACLRVCDLEIERVDAVYCELGGLMERIAEKVAAGAIEPQRVIRFFQSHDEHSVLCYKMIGQFRKPMG